VRGMNPPRTHIKLVVVAAAVVLVGAAVAAAEIRPSTIAFSGAGVKSAFIINDGSVKGTYRISVDPPGSVFTVNRPTCIIAPHAKCEIRVRYSPSGKGQDKATLNAVAGSDRQSAQLIGRSGGGGGGGGGEGPKSCTLHVARHQKLVKSAHGKVVRTPYAVSLTSSDDGSVTAQAVGKTAGGKQIFLENANSTDTAGNGVVLKLKLGRKSENLIRAELKAGRSPTMTLSGACSNDSGARQVGAKLHFSDGKHGKGFKLPLEADATVK
jgi:hypothetical protein